MHAPALLHGQTVPRLGEPSRSADPQVGPPARGSGAGRAPRARSCGWVPRADIRLRRSCLIRNTRVLLSPPAVRSPRLAALCRSPPLAGPAASRCPDHGRAARPASPRRAFREPCTGADRIRRATAANPASRVATLQPGRGGICTCAKESVGVSVTKARRGQNRLIAIRTGRPRADRRGWDDRDGRRPAQRGSASCGAAGAQHARIRNPPRAMTALSPVSGRADGSPGESGRLRPPNADDP